MVLLKKQSQGFALLMSLIVVSVVVSIGLSVLDLTIKQLKLSTNSKDSEIAFHAANAALECARYWRENASTTIETGGSFSPTCFGGASVPTTLVANSGSMVPNVVSASLLAQANDYTMEFTWGNGSAVRCSEVYMLSIDSDTTAPTTVDNMDDLIEGYAYGSSKTCDPNAHCTVISVRGYSRACSQKDLPGTVQREVLLEL